MARLRWIYWAMMVGLLPAASGFAQQEKGRPSVQVHFGYVLHEENTIHGGIESGFGFTYPLSARLSLSFEFSRWKSTSTQSLHKLYDGTISISPILVSAQYEFLQNKFFFPYAFAGGGFVIAGFKIGSYVSIPEVRIDQEIENGPAMYFGLGARIALSKSVNFFSEASCLMRTAPAKTIIRDMNRGVFYEDIVANLRSVFLKFGLKLNL